jgi:hypothetical protein
MMLPTQRPTDPRTIKDFAEMQINEPFVTTKGKGCRKCTMNYKGRPLTLQTPRMRLPFVYRAEDTSISGAIVASNEHAVAFQDLVKRIDEFVIQKACENSASWLGKAGMGVDVARQLYKGAYKTHEKYDPTFKMKFLTDEGTGIGLFNVWDDKKQHVETSLEKCFQQNAHVTAIVECTGVWIAGGNYGCNWRIRQLKVQPPDAHAYMFDDDAPSGDESPTVASIASLVEDAFHIED